MNCHCLSADTLLGFFLIVFEVFYLHIRFLEDNLVYFNKLLSISGLLWTWRYEFSPAGHWQYASGGAAELPAVFCKYQIVLLTMLPAGPPCCCGITVGTQNLFTAWVLSVRHDLDRKSWKSSQEKEKMICVSLGAGFIWGEVKLFFLAQKRFPAVRIWVSAALKTNTWESKVNQVSFIKKTVHRNHKNHNKTTWWRTMLFSLSHSSQSIAQCEDSSSWCIHYAELPTENFSVSRSLFFL